MRTLYKDQIVDYNDGNTEFVKEFNEQIKPYGAIVYNFSTNTYQYIRRFEEVEFINEIDPWYFRCTPSSLPKGIDIEMFYGFDPESFRDDEEVWPLWLQAVEEGLPEYDYDDDGEIFVKQIKPLTAKPTRHTIWILDEEGADLIGAYDQLMILPMIKLATIPRKLIREHSVDPWDK